MSPILVQLLSILGSAIAGALSMHLYHTSGPSAAPGKPAASGKPALFPNHPIASQAVTDILDQMEQAALAAAREVFNAQMPAPSLPSSPAPAKAA